MVTRIVVKEKLGVMPATARQSDALVESFQASKVDWVLDFEGVTQLTEEFIEGFFLKIAELHGPRVFERRLTWMNLVHAERMRLHRRLMEYLAHAKSTQF